MPRRLLALLFPFALLTGCSSLKDGGDPPDGLACGSVVNGGGDAASLSAALGGATPGTCVLVVTQTYTGHFVVPAGVTLASSRGSRATFVGDGADPVIDLQGGQGTTRGGLASVDVSSAKGVGVAVRNGGAKVTDVAVQNAKVAALAIRCDGASCGDDAHGVALSDVRLTKSSLGLWMSGATVTIDGGDVSDQTGETLTGGMGVVAQKGAKLIATGLTVERNAATGILIDGQGGTTASLKDVVVTHNASRGIWLQRAQGTLDAPAVRIEGASNIEANAIVGVGGADAHGIIIVGGRIAGTTSAPVVTSLGTTEQIGDGVGIFAGGGDIKLDGVEISANARAAALFDTASGSIIIVGGKVEPGASQLKVVVQSSNGAEVQVPSDAVSMPATALGVSAPIVSVGEALP